MPPPITIMASQLLTRIVFLPLARPMPEAF